VDRSEVGVRNWDAFVDECDEAWLWHRRDLQRALTLLRPSDDVGFTVTDEAGSLVAVVPLHVVHRSLLGRPLKRLESFGGPAVAFALSKRQRDHVRDVIQATMVELADKERATRIDVMLSPLAPAFAPGRGTSVNPLLEWGYQNTLTQTWVVDLADDADSRWTRYSQNARQEVRKAAARSTIREASGLQDLDCYYRLHAETYARTGARPHPFEYFETIFRDLVPKGMARVLFAVVGDEVVAAQNTGLYKEAAVYWTGASATDREGGENRLLCHEQVTRAAAEGRRWYEMGEAFPGTTDQKLAGLSGFKRSFGAELHPLFRGRLRTRPLVEATLRFSDEVRVAVRDRVRGRA
jgi:hypothetical protein